MTLNKFAWLYEGQKFSRKYDGQRLYFYNMNKITPEEFFKLEELASVEAKNYKIFLTHKTYDGLQIYSGLN